MTMAFEEEVMRIICACASQLGRSDSKKDQFCNDIASKWNLQNHSKMIDGLENFNGHVGRRIDDFEGVRSECGIGERNVEESLLLWLCNKIDLRVADTWFKKEEQRK